MDDTLIAIARRLMHATTALENAEEQVKREAKRLMNHVSNIHDRAARLLEIYSEDGKEGDLDPSPCLMLAEKLEETDRQFTVALNERAVRRREVEILQSLLETAKKEKAAE